MPGTEAAAVVLAAGRSRRFGRANKLLRPVAGTPMVRRVVETALESRARPVIVVTGHEADAIEAALAGLPLVLARNPDYGSGLASSLGVGIATVPADCAAALVLLGDMPHVQPATLAALVAALDPHAGRTVAVPTFRGRRGNPVIWHRTHFSALMKLEGDRGARALLATLGDAVRAVPVADPGIHVDFDSEDAMSRDRSARSSRGRGRR